MHTFATLRRSNPRQIRHALRVSVISAGIAVAAMSAILSGGGASATSLAVTDGITPDPIDIGTPRFPASVQDFTFWEMNVYLPEAAAPSIALDYWFIEINRYGEDFVFDTPTTASPYPSPDDVPQPRDGVLMY